MRRMLAAALVAATTLLAPRDAAAQPPCAVGTLADYTSGGPCRVGGIAFSNFTGQFGAGQFTSTLSPLTGVNVTVIPIFAALAPGVHALGFSLRFNPALSASPADAIAAGTWCADPSSSCFSWAEEFRGSVVPTVVDPLWSLEGVAVRTQGINVSALVGSSWLTSAFVAVWTPVNPGLFVRIRPSSGMTCSVFPAGEVPCAPDLHIPVLEGAATNFIAQATTGSVASPPMGTASTTIPGIGVLFVYSVQAVPEPSTVALLAGGLLAVGALSTRRGRRG